MTKVIHFDKVDNMSRGMNKNTKISTVKSVGQDADWQDKKNAQLVQVFLSLKNEDEVERFLRDLMTIGEIEEFARRLEAASLLSQNTQYNAIAESTGLSTATIARVAKFLKGSLGGYQLVLHRIHSNKSKPGKGLNLK